MARKTTETPVNKESNLNMAVVHADAAALDQLAVTQGQHESHVRAIALQVGYQLPGDMADPDLIQRDIGINMQRSVLACLEVGRALTVLKAICGHGNFVHRLDVIGIDVKVAARFSHAARKFSKGATSRLLNAAGNQSKLFELLVLDEEQIDDFELTGQTGELTLDDVATMTVKELRDALRLARKDDIADKKLLKDRDSKIRKLERHIEKRTVDEVLLELQKESTAFMNDALGCLRGQMRAACIALRNHTSANDSGDQTLFMAGLLGQIQAELLELRAEFDLPDVSNAADAELAAEVAQWAK